MSTTGTTSKSSTTTTRKRNNRKANTVATTTDNNTTFEILTEEPNFQRGRGRGKSPLRIAMESLEAGQYLVAGTVPEGEDDDATKERNSFLASVRQKAQEIAKDEAFGHRYSVRVDAENRVIVSRKADKASEQTS